MSQCVTYLERSASSSSKKLLKLTEKRRRLKQISTAILNPEPEPKKPRLFGSYFSEQQRTLRDAKTEVEKYLSSPRQNPEAEVIQFWKENSASFPRLAKVTRVMFSIPSGSARVERVFSAAGLLSRNHRMSLKPQTLSRLVFLKVNSKEL